MTIGTGIVVSPSGVVSVSGATEAADFPVTDGGLRSGMGGNGDGFIVSFADSAFSITSPSLLPLAATGVPYNVTLTADAAPQASSAGAPRPLDLFSDRDGAFSS